MKIWFISLVIILFSCSRNSKEVGIDYKENQKLEKLSTDTFSIKDWNYLGTGKSKKVLRQKDSLYFITLNTSQQKLELVNLTAKKIDTILDFYNTDQFLKRKLEFGDFLAVNLDSIFLFSNKNAKLCLINSKGVIKKIWNINDVYESGQTDDFFEITTVDSYSFHFDLTNKNIHFRTFPPYNFDSDKEFYIKAFARKFNLESENFLESFGEWPDQYANQDFLRPNNYNLSYIPFFDKGIYFLSMKYDHNIYKYQANNDSLVGVFDGKSNFLNTFEKLPRKRDAQKYISFITTNGSYNRLMYEEESNRFYRVVVHEQPLKNPLTNRLNNPTFNRSFSIIAFDENMIKIGEMAFDGSAFTFFAVTPTPSGIVINSKNIEDESENIFTHINF